jgi:hypothetical protein
MGCPDRKIGKCGGCLGKMTYQPGGQPSAYPSAGQVKRNRQGIPWFMGCFLMLFGFVVGVVALALGSLWYFGSAPTNNPLPVRPTPAGQADITAQISEGYINTEIQRQIKSNPVSLGGVIGLKDLVVNVRAGNLIDVQLKVGSPVADFDISLTERVAVADGQITLRAEGNPKVGNGNIPIDITQIINVVNRDIIQPRLNDAAAKIAVNGRNLRLVDITTANQIITVKLNAQ